MAIKPKAKYEITAKDRTRRAIRSARRRLNRLTAQAGLARLAFVALAGIAGMGLLVRQSFKLNDVLAKTADKLGITTEALAGLQHAASITGGIQDKAFNKGLQNMIRTIRDANNGLMTYKRSYEELGVDIEKLQALSPEQQFMTIAEALKNVESNTRRVGIAYDIFGAKNTALLNTLTQGRRGLEGFIQEAKDLNIAMSRFDAKQIEDANDAMDRAKKAIRGVANSLAVALAPILEDVANDFTRSAIAAKGFKNESIELVNSIVRGFALVGNVIHGVKLAFKSVATLFVVQLLAIEVAIGKVAGQVLAVEKLTGKLPASVVAAATAIEERGRIAAKAIINARTTMDEEWNKPLPTQTLDNWLTKVRERVIAASAEFEAINLSKTIAGAFAGGGEDGGGLSPQDQAAIDSARRRTATLKEIEDAAFAQNLADLELRRAAKDFSRTEWQARVEIATRQHEQNLTDIKRRATQSRARMERMAAVASLGAALGQLASAAAATAQHNKKMFKIWKASALAQAVISTMLGVTRALSLIFPLNFIVAALVAAAGMIQIKGIKKTKYGGGGSVPSAGGGGGGGGGANVSRALNAAGGGVSPFAQQQQQPQRQVNITLLGEGTYDDNYIRDKLIPAINDAVGDGVTIAAEKAA